MGPPPMVLGEIPPFHAEVLGDFSFLAILSKMEKVGQNLCMGWGLVGFLSFLAKWAKTRCVSGGLGVPSGNALGRVRVSLRDERLD